MIQQVNIVGDDQLRAIRLDQFETELSEALGVRNLVSRNIDSRYVYIEFETVKKIDENQFMDLWRSHKPKEVTTIGQMLGSDLSSDKRLDLLTRIIISKYGYEPIEIE